MIRTIGRLSTLAVCLLVWAGVLGAATRTWSGAASSAWSNAANWQEGIVPAAGDALVFPAGGAEQTNNDLADVTYQSLTVLARTQFTGNPITVGSGGITVGPLPDLVYFTASIVAAAPQTWTCNATLSCHFEDASIDSTVTLHSGASTFAIARGNGSIIHQSGTATVYAGPAPVWSGTIVQQGGSIAVAGQDATAVDVEMNVPCDWTGCPTGVVLSDAEIRSVNATGGRVRAFGQNGTYPSATLETLSLGPASAVDMLYNHLTSTTTFRVANPFSIGGIPLSLGPTTTRAFLVTPGTVYTLLDYTGAGPITGTFAGLPQGATIRSRNGQRFQISYTGGDGNDAALTALEHYSGRTDFDGNGRSEIFWRHAVTGENYRWTMNGPVRTGAGPINQVADTNWKAAGTADFDGDGDSDVLWRHALTGEVYMYLMQDGAIQSAGPVSIVDTAWQLLGTGDFDGDGRADVFWRHQATAKTYVYFMNGRTIEHAGPHGDMGTSYTIGGVGDFNADGTDDILWYDPATREMYVWLMDDLKTVKEGPLSYFAGWSLAGVGQFNTRRGSNGSSNLTDHKADVILRHDDGRYEVHLVDGTRWRQDGANIYGLFFAGNVDPAWKIAATGDYNHDGTSDILWRHGATGENYLYQVGTETAYPYFSAYPLTSVPDTNWQVIP